MKRRLLIIAICLLLGAVVNVAVAWGCAGWLDTPGGSRFFASPSSSEFFELLLTHTRQGLFSDPAYGGNRDFIGWKSIGYPGPRFLYTAEMQTTFAPLELPLRSLADM